MNPTRVGPYQILDKIGSGGMGTVYLGKHVETARLAAVKVLPASLAREEGFVERFNREIESLRRLSNPHIVTLYESGVDDETYYYAMEYVPGESLLLLLHREKRLPWRRAVEMAIQICQALKAAHDAGIIHRDLKPSNLLITPEGNVKLTDFGVAQVFAGTRLTVPGGIIGTAEYMSPEQAQGKRATRQSDLYSLGAVLYVLVTGRPPFAGKTAIDVIQKHKFGQFDRPRLYVTDLPLALEEVICQLLEKDPAKRFPDAFVLLRRLEQLSCKEELIHDAAHQETGVLLTEEAPANPDGTTVSKPPLHHGHFSGQGPATLMKDLVRAELTRTDNDHWLLNLLNATWAQVALLLLVIAGGVWWFRPRELTPAEKFAEGVKLLDQQPGPEWNRAKRVFFQPLVESDPETWEERVAPYLAKIDLYLLTRPQGTLKPKSPDAESDVQPFLRRAQRYQELGDTRRAEAILTALLALLEGDPTRAKQYDLARQYLDNLRAEQAARVDRYQLIKGALVRAARLATEGKTAEARQLWSHIVELYDGDPGAAEYVEQARHALERPLDTELKSGTE